MRSALVLSFIALLLLSTHSARGDQSLTVVELFTSQGCSSCPPADAFLGELAQRDDVLALSQHVDYWDYLGWKDPFASAKATQRQSAYRDRFGLSYVYTPQMVVQGAAQTTGTDRPGILQRIEANRPAAGPSVDIRRIDDDQVMVEVGGMNGTRQADVWLVFFDHEHATDIRRGENRGRR